MDFACNSASISTSEPLSDILNFLVSFILSNVFANCVAIFMLGFGVTNDLAKLVRMCAGSFGTACLFIFSKMRLTCFVPPSFASLSVTILCVFFFIAFSLRQEDSDILNRFLAFSFLSSACASCSSCFASCDCLSICSFRDFVPILSLNVSIRSLASMPPLLLSNPLFASSYLLVFEL